MRVRNEIANKLKAHNDSKALNASKKGASFTEQMSRGQRAHVSTHQQSHVNQRRYAKNISTEQAHRLAAYAPVIQECSRKYKVPVELICGVILQESGGNPKAVSSAGAKGVMQLMPATAKRFGVTNSLDPRQNIEGGTKYLKFLLDRFKGDYRLALAGYNAGEANVEKYGNKIPPFAETRAYVPSVLAYADTVYQILRTPVASSANLPAHAKRV